MVSISNWNRPVNGVIGGGGLEGFDIAYVGWYDCLDLINQKERALASRAIRRIPATEVKTHFGRIVQEVATSDTPIIIQTKGKDQAAIVSLHDLQKLATPKEGPPVRTRERVRAALQEAGMLSEPPPEMRRRAEEYDTLHAPEQQEQVLSHLRSLHLEPSLSDIILINWERHPGSQRAREK